jgi:hypothetical protein
MRERERGSRPIAGEATPSLDLVFDLLSNQRRRYALYYLYEQSDGVATVDELADSIVANEQREAHSDSIEGSDERRETIRTELQHAHLPKLADAGMIEHDRRSETVRYWTQPSLEEWLEHAYYKELA